MEKSFSELVKEAKLTKTGKIIADYILDNMIMACFLTSTELASNLNVSEASVIRFSRAIGFTGYIDFQKYLQRIHMNTLSKISDRVESSSARYEESLKPHPGEMHFGIEALKIAQATLRNLFRDNGSKNFENIINIITRADTIFIASSRYAYPYENQLVALLSQLTPNVVSTGGANTTILERMTSIDKDDCLIMFHIPPYTKLNTAIMDMANDSNAQIIAVTTNHNADLPSYIKHKIVVDLGSNSFAPSMIGITFLIELIANGVSREMQEVAKARLEKADYYMQKYKLVFDYEN
ncbi:MAG: MurR/RpiR family transcriptional regulator [Lachnospiraceae bacterium]|nr:MurR/RpiR family transcriptional regulator [Lachnospiraceae bacterium]